MISYIITCCLGIVLMFREVILQITSDIWVCIKPDYSSSLAGRPRLRSFVSGTLESTDKNCSWSSRVQNVRPLLRGTLCQQNCVLLLCVLTLSANNWKLACSRALTESALDDILDCLFCAIQTRVLIDWLCRIGLSPYVPLMLLVHSAATLYRTTWSHLTFLLIALGSS